MTIKLSIHNCLSCLNDIAEGPYEKGISFHVDVSFSKGLKVRMENDICVCELVYTDSEGTDHDFFPCTDIGMYKLKKAVKNASLAFKEAEAESKAEAEESRWNDLNNFLSDIIRRKIAERAPNVPDETLSNGHVKGDTPKSSEDTEDSVWVPTKYQPYAHPSLGRKHFGLKVFMDDIDDRHFIRHNMYFPANPEGIHEAVKTSVNMFSAGVDNINQQTK